MHEGCVEKDDWSITIARKIQFQTGRYISSTEIVMLHDTRRCLDTRLLSQLGAQPEGYADEISDSPRDQGSFK